MEILIKETPPGPAPEWVRQAWVGLILPISTEVECKNAQRAPGYDVPTIQALNILSAKNIAAALWLYENIPALPKWIFFSNTICVLIADQDTPHE